MAVATETKEKTREEIFLEYTIERQKVVQACILEHLRRAGAEGCFICALWDLQLHGSWLSGEEVVTRFDVSTALSVFMRKKQIVVHGGLRVALAYPWL
jgi:hypothetical protein